MKLKYIIITLFLLSGIAMAQNKVAILDFKNNGPNDQQHLSAGIANMLATTLAGSAAIEVAERSELDRIVLEMKLGMTGLVDPKSAAQVGKVAGANLVVIGSYTALGKSIRLDAKVVNVETAVVIKGAAASAKATNIENLDDAVDALAQKLLTNLTGEQVKVMVQGDPNKTGRLEFAFSGKDMIAVLVDGQNLEPTENLRSVMELAHGRHKVQIERATGMFKSATEVDTLIEIPGGYIVRAEYKSKKLKVFEIVPIPGNKIEQASVTTTTVGTHTEKVTADFGPMTGKVSIEVSGMEPATTTTSRTKSGPSKIVILSSEGMCDVYLDGKKRVSLPLSGIDEMATATIYDIKPGTYHIKIEGFEVWHEGTLKLNPGEEIKIRVEPKKFEIIGRTKI